jgi:hypothetical protein
VLEIFALNGVRIGRREGLRVALSAACMGSQNSSLRRRNCVNESPLFTTAGNLSSLLLCGIAPSQKRNPDVLQRDEAIILLEFIRLVHRGEQLNTKVAGQAIFKD